MNQFFPCPPIKGLLSPASLRQSDPLAPIHQGPRHRSFSPPIDLQERFLFSCDIERGGGSARARPSFGIEGAMDHESDRLNQKHGKSWGEHGRRRVPLLVLRPDDSIYRLKRRTDDGRRSQALRVVRWLTNWKARSGGSCLFKARITTAWECGMKRKGGMWGRMDKMGFVLFLSLPPIPPQLEKPDTRRVYHHVALIQVVIAPAENRNSFHGHRTSYQVSAMRRGTAGRDETSNALGSFERDGERCR